jgi:ABC-type transport system involved in Fe-S cluster assembly fused permease/ATPase subunit
MPSLIEVTNDTYDKVLDNFLNIFIKKNSEIAKKTIIHSITMASMALNIGTPFALTYVLPIIKESSIKASLCVVSAYIMAWGMGHILVHFRNLILASLVDDYAYELMGRVTSKYFYLPKELHTGSAMGKEIQFFSKIYDDIAIGYKKDLIGGVLPTVMEIALATVILTYNYQYVGLQFVGFLGFFVGANFITQYVIENKYQQQQSSGDDVYETLRRLLNQYDNAHYNGQINFETKQFNTILMQYGKSDTNFQMAKELNNIFQSTLSTMGLALIFMHTVYNVKTKSYDYDIDDFLWLFFYLTQLSVSLTEFSNAMNSVIAANTGYKDYEDYLKQHDVLEGDSRKKTLVVDDKNATIKFLNVGFSYDNEEDDTQKDLTLNGVSFTVPSGKKYGLVGKSGSGKSTILQLLYRFYESSTGDITINGQNITQVKLTSLRNAIAVVPQDPTLFNDTIYRNVGYGASGASKKNIDLSIQMAGLAPLVQKIRNRSIGEKGSQISGGERKRIALAQCYVKMLTRKSSIIILDEATVGLDEATEKEILDNFYHMTKGKTVIIVTHHLSTLYGVDQILSMENGKISNIHTYSELVPTRSIHAVHDIAKKSSKNAQNCKLGVADGAAQSSASVSIFAPQRSRKSVTVVLEDADELSGRVHTKK